MKLETESEISETSATSKNDLSLDRSLLKRALTRGGFPRVRSALRAGEPPGDLGDLVRR